MSRARAAQCAGIHQSTLEKWIGLARKGVEPYAAFFQEIKEAERHTEEDLLALIREHAIEDWKAGAWLLERRYQDRYALKTKVQHEIKPMTPEQALARYRELTGHDWPGSGE